MPDGTNNDAHEYRVCPRCERELPLTEECWYPSVIDTHTNYKNTPFPLWCRDCDRSYQRIRFQSNTEYRSYKREYQRKHQRERYQNDPDYRAHKRQYSRQYQRKRYQDDPKYRKRNKLQSQLYYHRKRSNVDRVIELEAQLAALENKEQ